jgi:predicted nucleic acid-binding protein
MTLFVDTSAIFALLVRDDAMHVHAKQEFARLADQSAHLTTSSYVLVESTALLQRRVGLQRLQHEDRSSSGCRLGGCRMA